MALPVLDATFASAADLPRRMMLARWLADESGVGTLDNYYSLPEKQLWARIGAEVGDKTEADYLGLPTRYIWRDIYNGVAGSGGTIDWSEKEALGHIAAAYRGDTGNPAALATYINWPWRYQVASIIEAVKPDADTLAFITASGATDIKALDGFVKGVKALGLWDSMVAWPLRSSQNAGTGTTAYSLGGLGTFNGTLVNGPSWGTDALDFSNDTSRMETSVSLPVAPVALMVVRQAQQAQGNNSGVFFTAGINVSGRQFGFGNSGSTTAQNYFGFRDAWPPSAGSLFVSFGTGVRTDREYNAFRILSSSAARVSRNTAQSASDVAVTGWDTSSPAFVKYGYYPTDNADDTLSFMAHFTAAIDNTTDAAFYNLYKSTLGTGLGLP
jgi:hypothetical protein